MRDSPVRCATEYKLLIPCVRYLTKKETLFRVPLFGLMLGMRDFIRITHSPSLIRSLSWAALNARALASIGARYDGFLLKAILLSFCPFESLSIRRRDSPSGLGAEKVKRFAFSGRALRIPSNLKHITKIRALFRAPLFLLFVGNEGFEPPITGPEPVALPLG